MITYISAAVSRQAFFFVESGLYEEIPEGLTLAELKIKKTSVLAYRGENFPEGIYLVYGTFDTAIDPTPYYYDANRDLLFEVSMIPEEEKTEDPEQNVPKVINVEESENVATADLVLLALLSLFLGAGLTILFTLLFRKEK